ncbi:MAG: lysylphosphatidylglycerol synthase transmembrane domain-containing protein [Ardenticatenia bacterium]|nr:lysylphosphatidylglycerol synthase transmembrane domain-containing protein [Ardenticatenia bacterium]
MLCGGPRLVPLAGAAGLYMLTLLVRAVRWRILVGAQGVQVSTRRLAYLYFVGSFFNMVLPSGVGGDVVKVYELSRGGAGELSHLEARVTSSVIADRASGLVVLFIMGVAAMPWVSGPLSAPVLLGLSGLTLGSVGAVVMLLSRQWRTWAEQHVPGFLWLIHRRGVRGLYASLDAYSWPVVGRAALVSLLFNGLIILVNVALGAAFRLDVPLRYYLVFVPIISFLLVLPVSINGLGVRESGYVALFGQVGVSQESALAMSLAFYAITLLAGLIGGLLYTLENALLLGRSRSVRQADVEVPR